MDALKENNGRSMDEMAPENSVVNDNQDPSIIQHEHYVPNPPKNPIQCLHSAKNTDAMARGEPDLLLTHGAGGDLHTPAVANFINGFVSMASRKIVFAFQGATNLKSRVSMFNTILDQAHIPTKETSIHIKPTCLGGRSMGARAAVMAARAETTHLVLVSYPLHTDKAVRDQILLEIPEHVSVIFVTGDHDKMCDLARLETVRAKMTCPTWRVVVHGADHGMNCRPKASMEDIQRATGRVVAGWLDEADPGNREGRIFWDGVEGVARWTGWSDDSKYWIRDGEGELVYAPFGPGGDVEKIRGARRGKRHATKATKGQSKSGGGSPNGTQPPKERKAEDQDTSEEGDDLTKQKSSNSRAKPAKGTQPAKKREAQDKSTSKEGTQPATKREAQDEDMSEEGDGSTKQKSSNSRAKPAKGTQPAKTRKAHNEDINKKGTQPATKREAQDEDTSEEGDGLTKGKSSKRRKKYSWQRFRHMNYSN